MENNGILSIIIPSYNVSNYIEEVLTSYIDDRLFGKVQVFLVDDGATDDAKDKADYYIRQYPHFFHFVHKENGGHGSVINYAIEHLVKTKYFKVIDGDDCVYSDNLLDLVNYLSICDDDLIISDCSYEYHDHQSISYGIRKENGAYNLRIHNVTYKTSIFIDNGIRVREHVFYEDSQYVLYPLQYVKKLSYHPGVVARYRQDEPTQSVNPAVQLKRKNQYELVLMDLLEYSTRFLSDDGMRKDLQVFAKDSITKILFGCFELNWAYSRPIADAISDCRRINKICRRYRIIYKNLCQRYKRFKQMRALNFNGIRLARFIHRCSR